MLPRSARNAESRSLSFRTMSHPLSARDMALGAGLVALGIALGSYRADPVMAAGLQDAADPVITYASPESGGMSGTSGDIIAVTGQYGLGTSVLYVIDVRRERLAVYEARGGSRASRGLWLVGARRIDRDFMIDRYNDESEFLYEDLERIYREELARAGGPADSGQEDQ